ncbi:MAG: sodium-dependent bicarbonate transport family permease [Gammaproteobacteria bacterium]|nr:sodium-dependent bicarbonate transport family permease [Gammaproteobacteria bacterium]
MDFGVALDNFLSPPILFFFLGLLAVLVRSDLEIPQPITKFLSLYLMLAIGFRGGVELGHSVPGGQVLLMLAAAVAMAALVPLYCFWILRQRLDVYNAAAIAATYGSISAVTFVTASAFLDRAGIPYGGYMVAAMALMEAPAIVVAVILARLALARSGATGDPSGDLEGGWSHLLRDAFFNSSVFLILGSLIVGMITGERGQAALHPFTNELFAGILCFFLLDMGIVAARRLRDLRATGTFLLGFAILMPLFNAGLGIAVATLLDLGTGDALLFTILCASASYIAVPAAMRLALPEANPGLSLPLALAVTFPLNITLGLPLYLALIQRFGS